MGGTLYLGTSGFAYDEWRGPFYPKELSPRDMLRFYARRFNSVEINYTFRRQPSERTLKTWGETAPGSFRFSIKAHQRITHFHRLAGAEEAVSALLDQVGRLGPRLGPILFQCPPTLEYDESLIASFLRYLPPTFRYAFEFRHPSWLAARELIASHGAALCVAETDEQVADDVPIGAVPFGYLRLRRTAYSEEDMQRWVGRIRPALDGGSDVYCYFKHEEKGLGPMFAERLGSMIAGPVPPAEADT